MLLPLDSRISVMVDQADVQLRLAFNDLSGESGPGKSILLVPLSLALVAGADAGVIRENCAGADISAIFDAPEALLAWLREHELDTDDDMLILRRVIDTQDRKSTRLNSSH